MEMLVMVKDFTPSVDSYAARRILNAYRSEELKQAIHNLSLQFPSEVVTKEQAESHAEKVIGEMKATEP